VQMDFTILSGNSVFFSEVRILYCLELVKGLHICIVFSYCLARQKRIFMAQVRRRDVALVILYVCSF